MNGNNYVVDTNILIYLVDGDKRLSQYLEDSSVYISFITEIELLSFQKLFSEDIKVIKKLLSQSTIIDVNSRIKHLAVYYKSRYSLKIPDAIIAATTAYLGHPLITSDRHFKKIKDLNVFFYEK